MACRGCSRRAWQSRRRLVATAPLLAFQFGTVQLVALPANLLALPAVAPIMWLGMLQAALGGLGGPALALAAPLGWIDGPLLTYLRGVAGWFGDAPHGDLTLRCAPRSSSWWRMGWWPSACSRCESWCGRAPRGGWPGRPPGGGCPGSAALGACGAVLAGFALWRLTGPPAAPRALTVSFLDVGQGDSTLIQDPSGAAVLFDGDRRRHGWPA